MKIITIAVLLFLSFLSFPFSFAKNKVMNEKIFTSYFSVKVKARPEGYWTNTGLQISSSDHVSIQYAGGQWKTNPYWSTADAAGNSKFNAGSTYLRPNAPEGALIGKVGGNNFDGGSETFLIGNLASVPSNLTGTLWLTANDEKKGFGDNSGELIVQITVIHSQK